MLEEMIVTGAWWDYVDALASHPLGDVLVSDPRRVSRADAAVGEGSRHVEATCRHPLSAPAEDARPTSRCSTTASSRTSADREFFIRKAIGWALRAVCVDRPREVKRYVKANRDTLSPLSVREALKNL